MHRLILGLLVGFSVVHAFRECGIRQSSIENEDRISGGSFADPGEYPWMVSLQLRLQDAKQIHSCGGSVLDEYWIITAAHCVSLIEADSLVVVAGEYNLNSNDGFEQVRTVERILPHAGWNSQLIHHDIALLKLATPLDLGSRYVSPICLPTPFQTFVGPCVGTGWGLTEQGGKISPILKEVSLSLVNDSTCSQYFENYIPNQICTGNGKEGISPCSDDSGGPMVCEDAKGRFILTGIVSYGDKCGLPNGYSVFTEVSHYIDWIEQQKHEIF